MVANLDALFLGIVFLIASIPVGGIGYGFSAVSTPILLIDYSPKQISPILNFIELFQNSSNVIINSGKYTLKREIILFVVFASPGLAIGSILGSYLLKTLGGTSPQLKILIYVILIPLILLQAYGFRRSFTLKSWKYLGSIITLLIGCLYGVTTISGPPLALIVNNQGLSKEEYRFAISLLRVVESYTTFTSYLTLGIFSPAVIYYSILTSPAIIGGMAIGYFLSSRVRVKEDFRRVAMSFDAYVTGFGLSNNLVGILSNSLVVCYIPFFVTVLIDLILLRRYVKVQRPKYKTQNS
ncbi:sulfite exporter TauE/SafE family protein [Sulfolobus acidocaldarius]|uniref:Probable membrane transporter protein n=4 Tax=Sulfolobus acidocaldarius TaxID=2285 RepID=Q4J6Y8_SULAC|nr:sulfite exporter TauE/SafE family protein [Sulfolobus acidocaldarius]AAY81444.1 conserved membrane protein [Sulfolobus acidocaldarius DSM 639]AGE72044.1 hypothetical protein SacN8_10470 [Sulfolobus acidocaldarius N8]AGE74361.1 hypothetical protein SacRon12I_10725 [Sulfolobus acidocaldarius Ron12/I]ALU29768.1 hypothetical protein ATY89_07330 [Sulfolobus acidocaldarius]ALU32505.1 hypothetical protein ATZ20_10350 [Sulfolobus acidocaldarius]